jgi:hypothetical protein
LAENQRAPARLELTGSTPFTGLVALCYDRSNSWLDDWNGSGGHDACSWLLRTADAWLQLAYELNKQGKRL